MLDDNTIRLSLFRPQLPQHTQSRYFSDTSYEYNPVLFLEMYELSKSKYIFKKAWLNILVQPALDLRVACPAEGLDLSRTGFPT